MNNQIIVKCYDMDNAEQINEQYILIKANKTKIQEIHTQCDLYAAEIGNLEQSKLNDFESKKLIETQIRREELESDMANLGKIYVYAISCISRISIKIEQLKIPTFVNETNKFLEEGKSVVIFLKFVENIKILANKLNTDCIIIGSQSRQNIKKAIDDFNSDKSRVIICSSTVANSGISLEDRNGNFPRNSIISPLSSDIRQILGRICRFGMKTPTVQHIIFCANSEEKMCEEMKRKLQL